MTTDHEGKAALDSAIVRCSLFPVQNDMLNLLGAVQRGDYRVKLSRPFFQTFVTGKA